MKEQVILVTGCSTGIGFDCVAALKDRGHRVIASCRKEVDCLRLKKMGFETVVLDLNDSDSIQKAFSTLLLMTQGRLDVLINNAGFGQVGALEDIRRDVLRQQFETNVFGLLELTNLAIPVMRQQGKGRIINMSSILGVISLPFRGAYNASKYALEGLSDTLRLELHGSGIKVITIEPGPIDSQFRENCVDYSLQHVDTCQSYFSTQYQNMLMHYKTAKKNSIFTKTPQAAIKKIVHAIESKRPKIKYPVTFPAHLFILLKRVLSIRILDRILLFVSKKELA